MTTLFIDNKEVTLPKDFEVDYILENPFFTRNGEYTFDIDIDLKDVRNRLIYQSINRADSHLKLKNRPAELISDGVVIVKGSEIILSVDNDIAKIQIVSGNSELNYISRSNLSIRDLDFGTFEVDETKAYGSCNNTFPEYNYVCTPVLTAYDSTSIMTVLNRVVVTEHGFKMAGEQEFVPQPYLLYILEKLIELLGYHLEENALRKDERFSRIFLVNGYKTNVVSKMLPDWTVDEFIDEMEKFFNCVIIVNPINNKVRILQTNSYYENAKVVYLDNVFDELTKKYDQKLSLSATYNNVAYELPAYQEYKYMKIPVEVKDMCKIISAKKHQEFNTGLTERYDKREILHAEDYNVDFVAHKTKDDLVSLKVVDRFKDIIDKRDNNKTEINVIPAEMFTGLTFFSKLGEGSTVTGGGVVAVYARNINVVDETKEEKGLNKMIQEGIPKENIPDKLFVGLYAGVNRLFRMDPNEPASHLMEASTPMSVNDDIIYCHIANADVNVDALMDFQNPSLTLRLAGEGGMYNTYYKENIKVDTTMVYNFKFLSKSIPDQRSIFVIHNKKYYCKSLSTRIYSDGIDPMLEGEFYLMS